MDNYTCRHFSLANGYHDPTNLPALLRKLADTMETEGIRPMEILDLNIHSEIEAGGPSWSATLYWSPDSDDEQADD